MNFGGRRWAELWGGADDDAGAQQTTVAEVTDQTSFGGEKHLIFSNAERPKNVPQCIPRFAGTLGRRSR